MSGNPVNYRQMTTVPIRDMEQDGKVVFLIDIYGVQGKDLAAVPGGSVPMLRAVRRMGLDTERYQAWIWDLDVGGKR